MIKKKKSYQENEEIWEEYIKNRSDIYDKEKNFFQSTKNKERYRFDLHGFTLDQAKDKVKDIIHYCLKNKFKELLLITGKGNHSTSDENVYVAKDLGKLRYSVPEFIKTNMDLNKFIISINNGGKKDGGVGSILIKFKKS